VIALLRTIKHVTQVFWEWEAGFVACVDEPHQSLVGTPGKGVAILELVQFLTVSLMFPQDVTQLFVHLPR